jgi:oligosaccharide repeat unit polymerase
MAPLFGIFYGLWPIILDSKGELSSLFSELGYVQTLYLVTIFVLFGVMQFGECYRGSFHQRDIMWSFQSFGPGDQRRLRYFALFLGMVSLLAWMEIIGGPTGILKAYSVAKGGGGASSGITGELILLSYPALLLLALYCRLSCRVTASNIGLAIAIMMPHLLQGTLGGRRGPLFVSIVSLFLAYFIARGRRPKLTQLLLLATVLPLAMLFLVVNRSQIYIGSSFNLEFGKVFEYISPDQKALLVNDYVFGIAQVIKATFYQDFYFGWRYFVTFVVRPIPTFVWPTKYEDVNAEWLTELGNKYTYVNAIGFDMPGGASGGSIADGFQEFSWGVVIMFALLGRLFISVWQRHRTQGGKWTIALAIMLALSIYLPTQSFGAWGFRTMLAVLPVLLIWNRLFHQSRLQSGISCRNVPVTRAEPR